MLLCHRQLQTAAHEQDLPGHPSVGAQQLMRAVLLPSNGGTLPHALHGKPHFVHAPMFAIINETGPNYCFSRITAITHQ
jgi:hypothetical protein